MAHQHDRTKDHLDVEAALLAYGAALDASDFATLEGLFTDQAELSVPDLAPVTGAAAIVASIREATATRAWQQHLISVCRVRFPTPQRAEAVSNLISHKTFKETPDRVVVLCGRYLDTLECIDGHWRICAKRLEVGWIETRAR